MADNASQRGAVDLAMPLMIVAFVTMGGFLFWLNGQATAERQMSIVEDPSTGETMDVSAATTIAAADLQTDPTPFEGQMIRVAGLQVASTLGTQGFWLSLPNRNPFLVSMSAAVMAEGLTFGQGQVANVVGVLHAMGDSVLTAWTTSGTIGEGDRLAAEFASHYIEAVQVQVGGGTGGGASGSGGGN